MTTTRPPTVRRARPTLDVERALWREGHERVAGLDEVGRGAWAGPVSVGAALLAPGATRRRMPAAVRDSKTVPEPEREAAFDAVARWCAAWAVGHASALECDRLGMRGALALAARRALAALPVAPDAVVVDGPYDLVHPPAQGSLFDGLAEPEDLPALDATVVPVTGGDARCASVAAASVLAKVVRDRHMRAEGEQFPPYGFERNKGYPSPEHRRALRGYGLSAIHRRSWSYVADLAFR